MSVVYYIAETQNDTELSVVLKTQMSHEEVDEFYSAFDFLSNTSRLKPAIEIATKNGTELAGFISENNLNDLYFNKKINPEKITIEANRLLYNFCASFNSFIDFAEKSAKKKSASTTKDFKATTSNLFDNEFSYRFFYKLRNYCIHYDYPYNKFNSSVKKGVNLICEREHLLQYDGWGAIVSKDLKSFPDNIDISLYIHSALACLKTLELSIYYFYANDYANASCVIGKIMSKYDIKSPIVAEVENDDPSHGFSLKPIPIKSIVYGMKCLESHPNIKVNYIKI